MTLPSIAICCLTLDSIIRCMCVCITVRYANFPLHCVQLCPLPFVLPLCVLCVQHGNTTPYVQLQFASATYKLKGNLLGAYRQKLTLASVRKINVTAISVTGVYYILTTDSLSTAHLRSPVLPQRECLMYVSSFISQLCPSLAPHLCRTEDVKMFYPSMWLLTVQHILSHQISCN